MNYPLISEYIEAIKAAEDNFEELFNIRPVLGDDGNPVMSSGNFAVVFKMKDIETGKFYALKCFTKEQDGREEAYRQIAEELEYVSSTFLTPVKYLSKELFVDTNNSDESEFPVLLMEWVEGQTLDKYIRENIDNEYELSLLVYQFSRLAMWLMPQPFAHGDLKPDNILVRQDGTLVLVDYDGMYVPTMKGQKARELGSPDFRHPSRTEDDFNEHIDDFSLVSILLSLKAISLQPKLLEQFGASDRLLFSERDYRNFGQSTILKEVFPSNDSELNLLYALFSVALEKTNLADVSFRLLNLSRPQISDLKETFNTVVTEEDIANAWTDEEGVLYSADRKRLLKMPNKFFSSYQIKYGTEVVADKSFCQSEIEEVLFPNTVRCIGKESFYECSSLKKVELSDSIIDIGNNAFGMCYLLCDISLPDSIIHLGEGVFYQCQTLQKIDIPKYIKKIGRYLFYNCHSLTIVNGCNNVIEIEENAFAFCDNITNIDINDELLKVGKGAFEGCKKLQSIYLSDKIRRIENSSFSDCYNLTIDNIPDSLEYIGDWAFSNCQNLQLFTFPKSLTEIGYHAFYGCSKLKFVVIPQNVCFIGEGAFACCPNINSIDVHPQNKAYNSAYNCDAIIDNNTKTLIAGCAKTSIPNNVLEIGNSSFMGCERLPDIYYIPENVKKIGDNAFNGCIFLRSVILHDDISHIGSFAFARCHSLCRISVPKKLKVINPQTFSGCSNLRSLEISESVERIDDFAFYDCDKLCTIIFPNKLIKLGQNIIGGRQSLSCVFVPHNYYNEYKNYFGKYNIAVEPNAIYTLSAFSAIFGNYRIVEFEEEYSLHFGDEITVLFDYNSCMKIKESSDGNGNYNVDYSLLRIAVGLGSITGFTAFFTNLDELEDVLL